MSFLIRSPGSTSNAKTDPYLSEAKPPTSFLDAAGFQHPHLRRGTDWCILNRCVEDEAARITKLTRIEVLGFPRWYLVDETRRTKLETLVGTLLELPLDDRVVERAIELRRQKKMTVADAVIAGAALTNRLPLVTRNQEDFGHIDGLQIINPFRQQNQE